MECPRTPAGLGHSEKLGKLLRVIMRVPIGQMISVYQRHKPTGSMCLGKTIPNLEAQTSAVSSILDGMRNSQ